MSSGTGVEIALERFVEYAAEGDPEAIRGFACEEVLPSPGHYPLRARVVAVTWECDQLPDPLQLVGMLREGDG